MAEEETLYVGVNNPAELRKELLESSKEVIGILKDYDDINSIRTEKIEKIMELKEVLAEIKKLISILNEKLPTEKIRASHPLIKKPVKKSVSKVRVEQPRKEAVKKSVPKQSDEIRKLEDELSEIEARLNKMGV